MGLQMVEELLGSLATCLLSGELCTALAATTVENCILDSPKHSSLCVSQTLWLHIFWHVGSPEECFYKPETPGEEMLYRKERLRQTLIWKGKVKKTEPVEAKIS